MREIYLAYTYLMGSPCFTLLDDKSSYEIAAHDAHKSGYVVSQLHQDSTRESDPLISILVIAERRLIVFEPETISQAAINWLVDNGHLTLPPEAFQ